MQNKKRKTTKKLTTANKTHHKQLKNERQEPHQKSGMISGAPEEYEDPDPDGASIVLSCMYKPGYTSSLMGLKKFIRVPRSNSSLQAYLLTYAELRNQVSLNTKFC